VIRSALAGDEGHMSSEQIVAVTGASGGIGRAIAHAFAKRGANVGLISRGRESLEAAAEEVRSLGGQALVVPADVAEHEEVETAASTIEERFGPIDVWVNDAMATVFAPVVQTDAAEYKRATEVTYLGTVYGTMAALRRMAERDAGTIVQVGSALSYRAIPLQAAYCGAKYAIRGFTDSLRTELMADRSRVRITMVQLPGTNTPQFNWCRSRLPRHPRPVPPVYQPELAGRGRLLGRPPSPAGALGRAVDGPRDRRQQARPVGRGSVSRAYRDNRAAGGRPPRRPRPAGQPLRAVAREGGDARDLQRRGRRSQPPRAPRSASPRRACGGERRARSAARPPPVPAHTARPLRVGRLLRAGDTHPAEPVGARRWHRRVPRGPCRTDAGRRHRPAHGRETRTVPLTRRPTLSGVGSRMLVRVAERGRVVRGRSGRLVLRVRVTAFGAMLLLVWGFAAFALTTGFVVLSVLVHVAVTDLVLLATLAHAR
jgi:short-subunit dehydrogenase